MRILRERIEWRREGTTQRLRCTSSLTPEEQAHVRVAMRSLRHRYAGNAGLAKAMGVSSSTVAHAIGKRRVTADLAIRAARLARVPIGDILKGAWPKPGACPMCGRST